LEGGTVLEEDLLRTGKGGRALVSFSPTTRAALSEETSVRFRTVQGALAAEISSGTLVAEKQGQEGLAVQTPRYQVKPTGPGKATYLVAVLPDETTVVAAEYLPAIIVEVSSGESYTLASGQYAVIPPLSSGVPRAGKPGTVEAGQAAHGKINKPWHIGRLSHDASVVLVAVIVAGAALAITLPLTLGEEAPVSPVAP